MSPSGDGGKPAQSGLVDMGNISFYNQPNPNPTFTIADLANFTGSFSEMVLNVTWAQLQPAAGGALDTSAIQSAIAAVNAYNAQHGTNVGIKLRVWGGYTAPEWAKYIDGPPLTIMGQAEVDPSVYTNQTIGRFWTADYIAAWTSFQNALAAAYDGNPVIRGISQTAGAAATDEPFVPLQSRAPLSSDPNALTVNQTAVLQAGGYTDAAEMLTLRGAIADYSQWSTTPLDFTMNRFHVYDSGNEMDDANFTLAVLQQARNSSRLVQPGNHALNNPLYPPDAFVYGQIAADAALDPATAPASYQTASPVKLPSYASLQAAVLNGVAANTGDIELWDFGGAVNFTAFSTVQVQALSTAVASGIAPVTGAPDDGSALGFVAPAFVTGAAGIVAFSGTDAVLLASATTENFYGVRLTSMNSFPLAVANTTGIVTGSTSGSVLTFTGSLAQVNTVLASLTDTLQSGTDVVQVEAWDSSGHIAVRNVGVQISPPAASSIVGAPPASGIAGPLGNGIFLVGGVQSALAVGNLQIGGAGQPATLLAALAPTAYSTASLTIGGLLEVESGGTVFFSGALGAAAIRIDSGGAIDATGTLAAAAGSSIQNDGTIEAAADTALGLQRLTVANALTGTGTLLVDPGATLILTGTVGPQQVIRFAPNSIAQLSNDSFSPSTLVLGNPGAMQAQIQGFTFADALVLDNTTATSVSYDGATLRVNALSFALAGVDLTGLNPVFTVLGSGPTAQSVITFVPPAGIAPQVLVPPALRGAVGTAVLVPDVVLYAPLPASPASVTFDVTLTTLHDGRLSARNENGNTAVITGNNSTALHLSGTRGAVEQALQTLTYQAVALQPSDTITITAAYGALSGTPMAIAVDNDAVAGAFVWNGASGSFGTPGNWTVGTTPPGGANVAQFGAGTRTVSGNGAVGQLLDFGTTTLTGDITAQGIGSLAVVVDSGGTLVLAGGALLTAQQQVTVGDVGQGLLVLMGGALALGGAATVNGLVIGQQAGSNGTVLDLDLIAANGTVVVGAAGTGTFELLGMAASVSDGGADIGQLAGGQGSVTVNGGEWMNAGLLTVGDLGNGSLLVDGPANGTTGQVTAFNATIGARAGGQGAVTLTGGELLVADAEATSSSTLIVGGAGIGSLAIESGSEAAVGVAQGDFVDNNGLLIVGGTPGGAGRIRIGGNSALLVYGNAVVGGTAGVGQVIVGESANDTALFALLGTLAIGGTGQVGLAGANATLRASAYAIAPGGIISGAGTLSGDGGGNGTVNLASIDNEGTIAAAGGDLLVYGGVSGTGTLSVATGAIMTLQAAVGSGQTLAFSSNARVVLNDPHAFAGTITGFGRGDVLELANTAATGVSWSNGILTIQTAFGSFQLEVAGNFPPNAFSVQSDGLGGTNVTAGGWGDVHMTTFDGLHYDLQATGDFVAVRSTNGNPWQIQIRTASVPGATSITTELAAQLGDTRVTFAVGRDTAVYIDGVADTVLQSGGVQGFAGGTLARLSADTWRVSWNTGEQVTVSDHGLSLDWSVGLGANDGRGSMQGLLGTDSGWARDFQLPNGTYLQPPMNDGMLGSFADAWRVSPSASLFDDMSVPAMPATALPLVPSPFSPAALAFGPHAAASDPTVTAHDPIAPTAGDLHAAVAHGSPFGT